MEQRLSFRIGNFLYQHAFPVYRPLYYLFKRRQDADELALIDKFVKPGHTVLDIGANIGFYTEILARKVGPSGHVHAFEPDRDNFRRLQQAAGHLKNVSLHNVAVTDHNGELTLYTSHRLNVDHRTYKPEKYDSAYQVRAIKLDTYLGSDIKVNFIKMDIQGAEYLALLGMKELVLRSEGVGILMEFAPYFLRQCSNISQIDFLQFLVKLKLTLFDVKYSAFISKFNHVEIDKNPKIENYENIFAVNKIESIN